MTLSVSSVAAGVIENADGRRVTLNGATLAGFGLLVDNVTGAKVTFHGAELVGPVTTVTPTILTIVVLGDSTADGDNEWVRLLVGLWVDRYGDWFHYARLANAGDPASGWSVEGFVNSVLPDSTRIVSVWNPSFGGAGYDDYDQAMIDEYVVATGADIIIGAQGINMAGSGATVEPSFDAVESWILAGLPDAEILVSSENPVVGPFGSNIRDALRAVAAARDYPFVDIYQAFINYGDWESLLSDGVHPNAEGSQLWADTFNTSTFLTATGELVGTGDMTANCSIPSPAVACSTANLDLACTISA